MRRPCRRRTALVLELLVSSMLGLVTTGGAQTVRNGSIAGTITDDSGAALPGVTITLVSPALQVPQLLRTAGSDGTYQFVDLPVGTYRLRYELSGFGTLVREDIRITTGFAARVDAVLPVAALSETVTVRGESPLVDVTNTRGGATVTQELLTSVPTNLNHQDVMLLAGGAFITGPPLSSEVGQKVYAANIVNKTYGQSVRTKNVLEGIEAVPGEAPDFAAVEEVDIKTFGNTAETDLPGATVQLIFKSGGNQFHGRYTAKGQHRRVQSQNVDEALRAQGINAGDAIQYLTDFSADLGGRIVRDKLWFYAAHRDMRNERTTAGFSRDPGSDGVYLTADDVPALQPALAWNTAAKLSYQATAKHKVVGFWTQSPFNEPALFASRFVPYETTTNFKETNYQRKIEWQGVLSERLLVNTMYAATGYTSRSKVRDDVPMRPGILYRDTGLQTGVSFSARANTNRTPWRQQWSGGLNYYPAGSKLGSHKITAGYMLLWGGFDYDAGVDSDILIDYRLVYDRVAGGAYQPAEINLKNHPVSGDARENSWSAYVADTWNPTTRLSLNLGVRWQRRTAYVPPQVKAPGRFGPSGSFPQVDIGDWVNIAPRAGAAYDLFGDGKTVLKGTYGLYVHEFERVGLAQEFPLSFSQNSVTTTVFRWRDVDGNNNYTPGEVNLDPNGPDFLSVSGATNNIVNPDLKLARTRELTASLERQLGSSFSIRGLYLYKKTLDQSQFVNVLRPYNVYDRAFTRRDPGPDGILGNVDDGGVVTVYDYDPAYRGSAFVANQLVNTEDRNDSFQNFEITLNKRPGTGWFASTSLLATKNYRWLQPVSQSPNDDLFPLDETWDLAYRLAAGYELPYGLNVSTLYQAYSGSPGQRTYIFRAADPDRGPALPSSSTVTLRMEPFGTQRLPSPHVVNLRLSKRVTLAPGRTLTLDLDAFNALNTNVAYSASYAAGPSFGYVTRISPPRVLRFGAAFEF